MTIEGMISLMEQYAYVDKIKRRGDGRFETIIAALRAGQVVADKLQAHLSGSGSDSMPDDVRRDLTSVYQAWDTATKGEER